MEQLIQHHQRLDLVISELFELEIQKTKLSEFKYTLREGVVKSHNLSNSLSKLIELDQRSMSWKANKRARSSAGGSIVQGRSRKFKENIIKPNKTIYVTRTLQINYNEPPAQFIKNNIKKHWTKCDGWSEGSSCPKSNSQLTYDQNGSTMEEKFVSWRHLPNMLWKAGKCVLYL